MQRPMRILLPLFAALFAAASAAGQNVTWTGTAERLDDNAYRIVLEAAIPAGYHMYDMGPYDGGPNATTITFTPNEDVTLEGGVEQLDTPHRYFDELFGMEIGTFSGKARFAQRVKLAAPQAVLKAQIEWMICDDTSCMPPDDTELTIAVPEGSAAGEGAVPASRPSDTEAGATGNGPSAALAATTPATAPDAAGGGTLWSLIIEAILWGFAALLTPCVFPMVPMTVSFFMKGSGSPALGRFRAAMYGFFIVALYTLPIAAIILVTRILGGDAVTADIFNWLATHWLPNILFFLVFMVFAASFFGAFEITMPSWMVNKTDAKADSKGLAGIFFMALTLVLVSFSCTGPIVGSVLIKSTAGEFWSPIVTMLAFSVAFALPFTLFAFFPAMLKKLPKSGGWLNSVKVVLGFIEVALGLKFLSVADQTYHWGLLDREIYLAVWIVTFSLLGFYLLGKIKFAHDSDMPYLGVGRLALAIVTFSFVIYLLPGMWGAPLKGLSGYLPPLATQDFVAGQGGAAAGSTASGEGLRTVEGLKPKYSDFLHLPHGLEGFFDLREAEAYAEKVGKPLFIDFTGHGCVNCREMEARVWSDPEVLAMLRNDYVIVALYSDDKKVLPENEWVTTESGKVLKSLGKINSRYALTTYGVNAQPYYVLQGRGGKMLVPPRGYDLSIPGFVAFLRSGLEAYRAER
ncbi:MULTISPECIES: protein-disulfide reductase DsbD family protein [Alistipes]|uniref:protein-disulfide reductase DsbD family protein n=1 Tax=Alistipes TaxID=239759 RepID=UPI001B39DAE4|nr:MULTISPECIES: thioredoxin family protein [Alistipes]MBQ4903772.1 thioredoxin family protein [Alistipes sp. Marseille-P2263]MCI2258054.1 thioredoxin family protein [Alistipes dispar]